MGNYGYFGAENFTTPVYNSGIDKYLYVPPTVPMSLSQWPTLAEMILSQNRVVMMLDYDTNMTAMPWLLDEFSFMWETPFSPTNVSFPCTQQRPPGLSPEQQNQIPYMANHNLNLELSFAGAEVLIPAYTNLTQVNAVSGDASAGQMMDDCVAMWNRPPAWLLVDYYNEGTWEGHNENNSGSVFEVAAKMNGVTYNRPCCGPSDGAAAGLRPSLAIGLAAVVAGVLFVM